VIFTETGVAGGFEIGLEPARDERGYLARTFSDDEFEAQGLDPRVVQCSTSFNPRMATLRGLHFQRPPHAESKLVRCTRGKVFDVIVDLRVDSASYCGWHGTVLAPDGPMVYAPEGCAHGFITLEPDSEVHYQMSHRYVPSHAAGIRWDDEAFSISWPMEPAVVSQRDLSFALFEP
jgi:dTDP-4-dehydrorhamnose 3,5-epimerase